MPTKTTPELRLGKNAERRGKTRFTRELFLLIACWFAASLLLIGVNQGRRLLSRERVFNYEEGDLATEDFVIDADFRFVDEKATEKVVRLSRDLAPPVYVVRSEITESVLEHFDRSVASLEAGTPGQNPEGGTAAFPEIAVLLNGELSRSSEELRSLLAVARSVLQSLQYSGIFLLDPLDGGAASGIVEVVYADQAQDRRVTLSRSAVTEGRNLDERIASMDALGDLPSDDAEFIATLLVFFSEPNAYLEKTLTAKNKDEAEEATQPVTAFVAAGTRLLTAGEVVSSSDLRILKALQDERGLGYHSVLNPFLFMGIIFILGMVLSRTFALVPRRFKTGWLYVALAGSYILAAAVMSAFTHLRPPLTFTAMMPTALFTLLLAQLLQDRRVAVLSSVLMALLVYFLSGGNSYDFFITLAAGVSGTVALHQRETRMGLLWAGPRLTLLMFVSTLVFGLLHQFPIRSVLIVSASGALNGLLTGILSLAILPLLEHFLNTATTFRLLELSDQSVPILRRMRLQAPGTYIHSQNVAHLAEAACEAMGANGLLARVGAYYHDIGKVDQAHFFVENQTGVNKHDDLKASLSVAVIRSHVKIGMEKGRLLRLPKEVLDVIEQHHGTSVIRYFYDRALKENGAESTSPENFSYAGPRPRSREAAVVMLADSAEATTRTLKKPTTAKLKKYVWELIMDRFKMGELNESNLTLRDLEVVRDTFVHVLTGHFHSRIEYPREDEA